MATLTRKEKAWFNKLQKVLDECPFDTSDFDSYTIGDNDITVFTKAQEVSDHQIKNGTDLCTSVYTLDAEVYNLTFPFNVASSAG